MSLIFRKLYALWRDLIPGTYQQEAHQFFCSKCFARQNLEIWTALQKTFGNCWLNKFPAHFGYSSLLATPKFWGCRYRSRDCRWLLWLNMKHTKNWLCLFINSRNLDHEETSSWKTLSRLLSAGNIARENTTSLIASLHILILHLGNPKKTCVEQNYSGPNKWSGSLLMWCSTKILNSKVWIQFITHRMREARRALMTTLNKPQEMKEIAFSFFPRDATFHKMILLLSQQHYRNIVLCSILK